MAWRTVDEGEREVLLEPQQRPVVLLEHRVTLAGLGLVHVRHAQLVDILRRARVHSPPALGGLYVGEDRHKHAMLHVDSVQGTHAFAHANTVLRMHNYQHAACVSALPEMLQAYVRGHGRLRTGCGCWSPWRGASDASRSPLARRTALPPAQIATQLRAASKAWRPGFSAARLRPSKSDEHNASTMPFLRSCPPRWIASCAATAR